MEQKRSKIGLLAMILFISLLFIFATPYAEGTRQLSVKKIALPLTIKTGESVNVSLEVTNPFNKSLKIQVKDNNVVGGNGYNVECLEKVIPASKKSVLIYEPITAYSSGAFSLGGATISYTNPDTGKEDKVESNSIKVKVTGSSKGNARGITNIYECNGMSMRSTSFSSSGSKFSFSTSTSGMQQNQQQQMRKSIQKRQMSNQQSVNSNALKKQMEREMREREETKKKFEKNLAGNSRIKKELSRMASQHYNMTSKSIKAVNSTSGEFSFSFDNGTSSVKINGRMMNNRVASLNKSVESEALKSELMNKAMHNPVFKRYEKKMQTRGLKQAEPMYSSNGNMSMLKIPFKNPLTNETANISVNFKNMNITSVHLEEEGRRSMLLPLLLLLSALIIVSYVIYKKLRRKEDNKEEPEEKKIEKRDLFKEAERLIEKSSSLRGKEFAVVISEALRLLVCFLLDIDKEKDTTQLAYLIERLRDISDEEKGKGKKVMMILLSSEFAKHPLTNQEREILFSFAKGLLNDAKRKYKKTKTAENSQEASASRH